MDALSVGLRIGVPIALLVSLAIVRALDGPRGRWGRRVRSRLLLGVPWGTLTTIVFVLIVYLGLQQGLETPRSPLHIPFTSWSYFYPLGVLTAPFAHQGLGHVTGNVLGTIALAPLAEYAFSHFPTQRGRTAFDTWRTNPYVRAFVLFPAGAIGVGLLTSIFSWGPIIGFSGVVFAFAGFALVRYPLATVVALVARDMLGTLYYVLRDPVITSSASPSFGPPWWAGIAIQGHFLGFLLGVTLGAIVVSRRSRANRPSALKLWTGGLLVGSNMTLWAVWWYRDGGFVLYRGAGILLVVTLALVVTAAVHSRDEPLVGSVTSRQLAIALLTLPLLTMGFVAVPLNATVIEDGEPPGPTVEVDGYSVGYAEDVPHQRVGAIDISALGETTRFNVSGVIVTNDDRSIWTEAIPAGRLSFGGQRTTKVGGIGWSRSVTAIRQGWSVTGNDTVYQIALRPADENATWVYASEPARAEPTIAGSNVTIRPDGGAFFVTVTSGSEEIEESRLPARNESVTVGELTITRNTNDCVFAERDGTRVRVATKETYQ
ncbi:MAG: rhomboid family intramembrane serine protease [Halobacteriota archaeon]